MAPDFVGIPGYPDGTKAEFMPLTHATPQTKPLKSNLSKLIGGGSVETFAFGGKAPSADIASSALSSVQVGAPVAPFSLSDILGISSNGAAGALAQTDFGIKANPQVLYWPVPSAKFPEQAEALTYEVGDGASTDNSGLLSLLIRGTQKVLWVASGGPMGLQRLNMTYNWKDACAKKSTFDPIVAGVIPQVVDKFGYGSVVATPQSGLFWEHNQVFAQPSLLPLSCDLWEKVKAGEPAVVSLSEEVLAGAALVLLPESFGQLAGCGRHFGTWAFTSHAEAEDTPQDTKCKGCFPEVPSGVPAPAPSCSGSSSSGSSSG